MYPSIWQILIVLAIALIVLGFGPKKIRELGKSLGEGLRDFKKGLEGKTDTPEKQSASSPDDSKTPSEPSSSPSDKKKEQPR